MLDQNNTPPHPEGELRFKMQAMTQMMKRVEKRGKEAGTSTQDVRKLGLN
jgi:hypothetical protein